MVPASDWLFEVLGPEPVAADLQEMDAVLQSLMTIYNRLNRAVLEEDVASVLPPLPASVDDLLSPGWTTTPTGLWMDGFTFGLEWLEDAWAEALRAVREDFDDHWTPVHLVASFFLSGDRALQIVELLEDDEASLQSVFEGMVGDFGPIMAAHAATGRLLYHHRE